MEQIHDRVAGLDVHRDTVAVCVRTPGPRGGVNTEKARFDTTAGGLAGLACWLAELRVVRAENLVRSSDQQSCSPCRPAMMIIGHVPVVHVPPDHAANGVAAARPA